MKVKKYPKEFLEAVQSITNKRARIVIDRILTKGQITTEELKNLGYNHPPRAAKDVRDAGIPLITTFGKGTDGRRLAIYQLGDLSKLRKGRLAGRLVFSKKFKDALFSNCGGKCNICGGIFEQRYLQVDHRIPYEIAGDTTDTFQKNEQDYMLLCGSCNRAKSWSCEHCKNWTKDKKPAVCMKCYWGSPENYKHIATAQLRRVDIQWQGKEVKDYDRVKRIAGKESLSVPDFVKNALNRIWKIERGAKKGK